MIVDKQYAECDHCDLINEDNGHGPESNTVRRFRLVSEWNKGTLSTTKDFNLIMDLCGSCRDELRSVIHKFKNS